MTRLEVLELLLDVSRSLWNQSMHDYDELTADDLMRVLGQFIERERAAGVPHRIESPGVGTCFPTPVEELNMALPKEHVTLQDYFSHELSEGKTEFRIVVSTVSSEAGVKIYIHPLGKDGESRDFIVNGGDVEDITRWLSSQAEGQKE